MVAQGAAAGAAPPHPLAGRVAGSASGAAARNPVQLTAPLGLARPFGTLGSRQARWTARAWRAARASGAGTCRWPCPRGENRAGGACWCCGIRAGESSESGFETLSDVLQDRLQGAWTAGEERLDDEVYGMLWDECAAAAAGAPGRRRVRKRKFAAATAAAGTPGAAAPGTAAPPPREGRR
jgi:hypothetical protein